MSSEPDLYQFAGYCLDVPERRLTLKGQPVALPDKSFEVLHFLVQNAGKLVGKDELLGKLWPEAFVEESNLAKHVSILRKALEDGQSGKDYIETVPKRGYRFIAPISTVERKARTAGGSGNGHDSLAVEPPLHDGPESPLADSLPPAPLAPPRVLRQPPAWRPLVIGTTVICLAILLFAVRWARLQRGDETTDFQLVGVLTDSGRAQDLAISPDGHYVAYLQQERSGVGLRLRHIQTHSDIEILPPQYTPFGGVTFSPDNAYLYFVRGDVESSVKSLYRLPLLGGAAQKVRENVDSPVSFSPDGKQIAFEQHSLPEGMDLKIGALDGSLDELLAHFSDVVPTLVFSGPAWSPDGQTLAVSFKHSTSPERWILATVSLAAGRVQELYSSPNPIGRPAWLDGGKYLAIQLNDVNGHGQLWAVSFPRGQARRLIYDLGDYWYPLSASQDGRTLAAIALTGEVSDLWAMGPGALDKGHQISSGLPLYVVLWTADGTPLALSDDGQLWVIGAQESRHAVLSELPMKSHLARCAAHIVLTSYKAGQTTIFTANSDGSDLQALTTGRVRSPVCSPDGRNIYYFDLARPQRILRQSVGGGPAVELAQGLGETVAGRLTISPDGKLLAYAYRQRSDTQGLAWYLAILPTTGRGSVMKIKVPQIAMGPKWSPDGESLQFLLLRDGLINIWRQPVNGGAPEPTTHFENGRIADFDWSPDGKHLLVARGSSRFDVVLWSRRNP